MKSAITMLVLAFIFLVSSCEKEDNLPRWSKTTALKNGEPWEAKGIGRINSGSPDLISLTANAATSSGHVTERLVISNIPMEIGKHELKGDLSSEEAHISFYHMDGDDVLRAVYLPDKEADNFIEIRIIDLRNKEVAGIFKASFLLKSSSVPEDPAEVSFADGSFRFKIEEFPEE